MASPRINPHSARSDMRGITFEKLPIDGFKGRAPRWPKPIGKDKDGNETELSKRARALWRQAWKTPQASKWINEPWRFEVIAEYCLVMTTVENSDSMSAALIAQLHRYRDQLGLSPAGMKENGWELEAPKGSSGVVQVVHGGSRGRVPRPATSTSGQGKHGSRVGVTPTLTLP